MLQSFHVCDKLSTMKNDVLFCNPDRNDKIATSKIKYVLTGKKDTWKQNSIDK